MPMGPCSKCLENQWTFAKLDAVIIEATCKLCGYEVQFQTVKLRRKQQRKLTGQAVKFSSQRKANRTYAPFAPQISDEEIFQQTGEPPWE